MSWVATILLSVHYEDQDLADAFGEWLHHEAPWNEPSVPPGVKGVGFLKPLHDESTEWGGWKRPEARLWGGVTNHADVDAIVDQFGQMPWRQDWAAQLFLKDQEQDYFAVWMIRDGETVRQTPSHPPDE